MEKKEIPDVAHYIHDFVPLGAPDSGACKRNKVIMHETCDEVGLPSEPEKDEGQSLSLTHGDRLGAMNMVSGAGGRAARRGSSCR